MRQRACFTGQHLAVSGYQEDVVVGEGFEKELGGIECHGK